MTDPTATTETKKPIDWPQTAIAIAVLALLGVFWLVLEPERAEPATAALVTVLGLLGLAATMRGSIAPEGVGAMLGALFGRRSSTTRTRPRPEDDRRSGHVVLEVMIAMVVAAACMIAGALVSGCGASALGVHVRAATVATDALERVPEIVETIVAHRVETECGLAAAGNVSCVEALQLRMAPELAALDVGVIAVREPLTVYVSTLRLLAEADAGEEPDVVAALVSMAGRLVSAWPELAAALRALGADLPIPPLLELAVAVIGGAS